MFTPINSFFQNLMLTHREKSFSKFNVCTPGNEFFQNSMFTHQKMLFFKMQCSHTWKTFFRNWMITHQDLHFKNLMHTHREMQIVFKTQCSHTGKNTSTPEEKRIFQCLSKRKLPPKAEKIFKITGLPPSLFFQKIGDKGGGVNSMIPGDMLSKADF